MMAKTHIAGGMLSGSSALILMQSTNTILTTFITGFTFGIATLLFSSMSGILADIDKKESRVGRRLWFLSWPIFILQCICKVPSFLGIKTFKKAEHMMDHRGFTHYPITWLIVSCLGAVYSYLVFHQPFNTAIHYLLIAPAIGLSLGMLSHILLDLPTGYIRLLEPISDKRFGYPIISEGGIFEFVIRILLYAGTIKLLYIYLLNLHPIK